MIELASMSKSFFMGEIGWGMFLYQILFYRDYPYAFLLIVTELNAKCTFWDCALNALAPFDKHDVLWVINHFIEVERGKMGCIFCGRRLKTIGVHMNNMGKRFAFFEIR